MSARKIAALLGIALITLSVPALAQKKAEMMEKEDAKVGLEIGDMVPMTDAELTGLDGKATTIADAAGEKGTLVVFTCNSCPWVKAWDKRMASLGNKYMKKGIGVIAIERTRRDRSGQSGERGGDHGTEQRDADQDLDHGGAAIATLRFRLVDVSL